MFLVDTNVISALRRPESAPQALRAWAEATPAMDLYISAMSVYELELGILRIERRDSAQGRMLRNWFTRSVLAQFRDQILPVDSVIATRCAALHVPDPRPERDSFIAATALVHRFVLVTRNVRDFEPMGVEILNHWAA